MQRRMLSGRIEIQLDPELVNYRVHAGWSVYVRRLAIDNDTCGLIQLSGITSSFEEKISFRMWWLLDPFVNNILGL